MRRLIFFSVIFGLSVFELPAQIQRIMHQTFPVGDSTAVVTMDIYGEYEVEKWPGNHILLETQVKLFNATPGILEHFLEIGRFELEAQGEGEALRLVSKDKERRPITTSKGECFEEIDQRLFIPEEFVADGDHRWSRPQKKEPVAPARDSSAQQPSPMEEETKKQGNSKND